MEDLQLYITFFLATILFLTFYFKVGPTRHLPPSPRALPIIGHLHLLGQSPHKSLHQISIKYGHVFHLYLGSVSCVVSSSAETAKEFLKTHETTFSNRPQTSVVNYLSYPSSDFTFAQFGPYWKFMNKICVSRLLGGRKLDEFFPTRRGEIRQLLSLISERANSNRRVDVGRELTKLSSNVISIMIMSRRCAESDDEADEVRKVVNESTDVLGRFNLSDHIWFLKRFDLQGIWKKSKEIHDKFDQMMERIIKEHEDARKEKKGNMSEKVNDLLDLLLEIFEDQTEDSEIRLTREHIKAFVLDVLVAGTDTSSITTEWALSELINHPIIMKKAREEIESVIGKTRVVEESDIPNLPYIQAIVKETLRLHPPGPLLFRQASGNCLVSGYHIPKDTRLLVNVWAINRDPNHWEKPLEFNPERFLSEKDGSGNIKLDFRGQNFHFLPFGSGRRGCPGTLLGLKIVQSSLAAMIQCFEWKIDEKDGVVDMDEGHGFTLPRAHPLVCFPVARFDPLPI